MLVCDESNFAKLSYLLDRYRLQLVRVTEGAAIPGTHWGEPEAGLVANRVYARADTPVHSVLHEAGHVLCMAPMRRAYLHTDAGGDYAEEDAVCFLQIVLAQQVGLTAAAICAEMDAWGYSFRLGSAQAWFEQDADDARRWLIQHGLINARNELTWQARAASDAGVRNPNLRTG